MNHGAFFGKIRLGIKLDGRFAQGDRMKHYFFVNPAAGTGKNVDGLISRIDEAFSDLVDHEHRICLTDSVGAGERQAREIADGLAEGEEARFYACGGDGTVNEIANAVIGHPGAALGIIPIGTGNDTVRNFPEAGDFLDIRSQIGGSTVKIDAMRYEGIVDGREQSRYCINMFNIGFDCNVVELTGRLKQKPLISGSAAYLMAVFGVLARKKGTSLTITDGGSVWREGPMLLCSISNGSYCGGGIYSSPQARMDDGLFDICVINDVSRMKFISTFPKYKNGTHLDMKGADEILDVRRSTDVTIKPYGMKDLFICVDGEIQLTTGIRVTMCPGALNFVVPKKY